MLRRGDPEVYEIPASALTLIDAPLVWPSVTAPASHGKSTHYIAADALKENRVYDRDFVSQFYPKVAPFQSRELGIYWRGPIPLIDGSATEVVVIEDSSGTAPKYTINPSESPGVARAHQPGHQPRSVSVMSRRSPHN